MTDDLVTRIRTVFEDTPEVLSTLDVETYAGAEAHTHMLGMWETMKEAADRIEELEAALRKIAQHDMQSIALNALVQKISDPFADTAEKKDD
jgi:RPA family protein